MQSFTYTYCAPTFIYDFIRLLCLCGVSDEKGILLLFTEPIYFAADGNSGEMAFPLHEPVVCISTAQSKSPYLLAKPFGIFMLYNKYI